LHYLLVIQFRLLTNINSNELQRFHSSITCSFPNRTCYSIYKLKILRWMQNILLSFLSTMLSNYWLIIYYFTSPLPVKGCKIRALEQGRIFIVPHLLWHGASVFPVSSDEPLHSVASYNTQGVWRFYSISRILMAGLSNCLIKISHNYVWREREERERERELAVWYICRLIRYIFRIYCDCRNTTEGYNIRVVNLNTAIHILIMPFRIMNEIMLTLKWYPKH
jgi:hypothetical protein